MYYFIPIILIPFSMNAFGAEPFQPNTESHGDNFTIEKKENLIGRKTGLEISKAQPEDINSENYPTIVEGINFRNRPLKEIIESMSKALRVNIIMDPSIVNQKLSIVSESPLTVAEQYQVFLTALSMHNLAVVRSGAFLKIIKKEDALKSNLKVYTEKKPVNIDQIITTVIKLKHIDAASLEQKMKPFIDAKAVHSLVFYPPSNTVVISDYGPNIQKFISIIKNMDIPASEETHFRAFPIKHARAEALSKLINTLLAPSRRYTYQSKKAKGTTQKSANITSLSHDKRTNSIIVMANKTGMKKVKELIEQLDYYKDPELAGGIYVYKVKYGKAEELAETLNDLIGTGVSKSSSKDKPALPKGAGSKVASSTASSLKNVNTAQAFKDVKIIAEKNTNSLLIISNKYNYETILGILKKVDISRNQVFVKSIIMELSADRNNDWQIANYYFQENGQGLGRIGYGLRNFTDMLSPKGATLFFPLSLFGVSRSSKTDITELLKLNKLPIGDKVEIPTLSSFVKFLQQNAGANILSTPQIMALDNQEAEVTITETIPVLGERSVQSAYAIATNSTKDVNVETSLKFTPHINPDVNSIQLEIEQKIDNIFKDASVPEDLQKTNIAVKKRKIKTFITLKDKETAVLGGLVKETNTKTDSKIPLLGDLPLIGWLFKNSETDSKKSNLIVFITPHIVHSAEDHKHILSSKLKERMNFIRRFTGNKDIYKDVTDKMLNNNEESSGFADPVTNVESKDNSTINEDDYEYEYEEDSSEIIEESKKEEATEESETNSFEYADDTLPKEKPAEPEEETPLPEDNITEEQPTEPEEDSPLPEDQISTEPEAETSSPEPKEEIIPNLKPSEDL